MVHSQHGTFQPLSKTVQAGVWLGFIVCIREWADAKGMWFACLSLKCLSSAFQPLQAASFVVLV